MFIGKNENKQKLAWEQKTLLNRYKNSLYLNGIQTNLLLPIVTLTIPLHKIAILPNGTNGIPMHHNFCLRIHHIWTVPTCPNHEKAMVCANDLTEECTPSSLWCVLPPTATATRSSVAKGYLCPCVWWCNDLGFVQVQVQFWTPCLLVMIVTCIGERDIEGAPK